MLPKRGPGRPRKNPPPMSRRASNVPRRKSSRPLQTKKAFVRQRQGVVETKSRTHEEISENPPAGTDMSAPPAKHKYIVDPTDYQYVINNTPYTFFHPTSFLSFNQGMDEMDLNGLTAFVKAIKMKLSILLPHGTNAITNPFNLYLVHGTVLPTHFTSNTFVPAQVCSRSDIQKHIEDRVKDYFDERKDKLRFIPKSGVTVNIQGYEKLLNNKNTAWLSDISSAQAPYNKSVTFKMNKKVKYEKGYPQTGDALTMPKKHQTHLYPNYTHLPFVCLYSPQHLSLPQDELGMDDAKKIRVAFNDCTWFTDS